MSEVRHLAAESVPADVEDPAPQLDTGGTVSALLTIVVPTYRRPDLLTQCLHAIAAQTFDDFVVLVCDNSPEREAETVVRSLDDQRFVYVPRGRNIGMLDNVLAGFRAARTRLVMEVDDDDLLYPHAVGALVAPFNEDPELALVFGDLDVIDDNLRALPDGERITFQPSLAFLPEGRHQPFTDLAARGLVFLPSTVLRRDALNWDEVPISAATAYDRYLGLAAARNAARAYHVKERLVAYRVHERSDGLQFTARAIVGAIEVLSAEQDRSSGAARGSMSRELARSRFQLFRTYLFLGDVRNCLRSLVSLLSWHTWPGLTRLIYQDYLPELARGRSAVRLRGSLRARLKGAPARGSKP